MNVPKTLTEAANSQPATVEVIGLTQTSTNVREVSYEESYRDSTGVRETPIERLQRITAVA